MKKLICLFAVMLTMVNFIGCEKESIDIPNEIELNDLLGEWVFVDVVYKGKTYLADSVYNDNFGDINTYPYDDLDFEKLDGLLKLNFTFRKLRGYENLDKLEGYWLSITSYIMSQPFGGILQFSEYKNCYLVIDENGSDIDDIKTVFKITRHKENDDMIKIELIEKLHHFKCIGAVYTLQKSTLFW